MSTSKASRSKRGFTKADLEAVSDNPEWTKEDFARARPFSEVFPDLHASIKRSRGRPKVENPKEAVTLRLSPDTVEKFKAAGDDWRARMAKALERAKV
ncbi:MAG: BrnA antitoxin family protein [Xanthobacteraceae bacterium]